MYLLTYLVSTLFIGLAWGGPCHKIKEYRCTEWGLLENNKPKVSESVNL